MSNNKENTLVLFDSGSVLLKLNFDEQYIGIAKLANISPSKAKEIYLASDLEDRFLSGKLTIKQYTKELETLLGVENSGRELEEIYTLRYGDMSKEVVELKKRVYEAGYPVGIFSNAAPIDLREISKRHPKIYELFDDSAPDIRSCEIGAIKPDPKGYEIISAKGYDKIIFIDDNPSYVKKGIEDFGWYGILFTPFVDPAEAQIRQVHDDESLPTKRFSVANSVEELISSLNQFGVKV